MMELVTAGPDGLEEMPLGAFSEKAYLDYSMYVILDRALPHLADGLKPVQRRIVYAMSELGLSHDVKFKKSARTVGDVLGKFHPHGESACYEAMVLMAQPFSYRYPLVDGQGNWGSLDDPKSFAAMRYTEARLTHFSSLLLDELGMGTVEWSANFDGTMQEPVLLPSRVPNVLLNGASGIAVGMATDIPPHNLREVAQAALALLHEPKTTLDELLTIVRGPDFPTGAELITPSEEIRAIYERGSGSVRLRASYEREDGVIVVTSLPYQVSISKLMEQIAAQINAKKLPMVDDLRDESDEENPVRLVIVPRSNRVDVERLMSHLFASTDLERSYRVNLNLIGTDGRPKIYDLRTLLVEWLAFRSDTVKRRLEHRLGRVEDRLHRLDGQLVAYLNIDEVIAIIRREDQPKRALMERFDITDIQAEAILELRLRQLARLEEIKIRAEQDALSKEKREIESTLKSRKKLARLVGDELGEDAETFGDDRRTVLIDRDAARVLDERDLVPSEPVTVVLSEHGWVRAAKGHDIEPEQLNYRSGDGLGGSARGRSHQAAVFLDSTGRAYTLVAHSLPSARGQGEPLSGRLNPPDGARFLSVLMGADDDYAVLASDAGYGFMAPFTELVTKNRSGKVVVTGLRQNDLILPALTISKAELELGGTHLAVVSSQGYLLIYALTELPVLSRGKGVKLMAIPASKLKSREETVAGVAVLGASDQLMIVAGKRHLNLRPGDWANYVMERTRRGRLLPRGLRRVDAMQSKS